MKIMKTYKENTYIYREGKTAEEGKIALGVFRNDPDAEEYIERVEARLRQQKIERG